MPHLQSTYELPVEIAKPSTLAQVHRAVQMPAASGLQTSTDVKGLWAVEPTWGCWQALGAICLGHSSEGVRGRALLGLVLGLFRLPVKEQVHDHIPGVPRLQAAAHLHSATQQARPKPSTLLVATLEEQLMAAHAA